MKYALGTLGVALAIALGGIYYEYRGDLSAARAQLLAGSQIAQTRCGPIEYAAAGSGPAVLLIHGAGGGYSQVAAFSQLLQAAGFKAIAMSRFGYLRTPMPEDASAPAQADAHACLLDALGVGKAAAFGASAGAPSAMQFCIRHAQRCSALVLLVPAAYVPGRDAITAPPSPFWQAVIGYVLNSDFVIWAVTRLRPEILIETALATPLEVFRAASSAEQQRALDMARDIFPVSIRGQGLGNDGVVCSSLPRYDLEHIAVPTLAISGEDDLYGTLANARYTAEHVPGARLVTYPTGGHAWLDHDADVQREIVTFLRGSGG